MKDDADSVVGYLREHWGLPLVSACPGPALPRTTAASEIVRRALSCGDLRIVRALPLWLSLVPVVDSLPPECSVDDRRRIAYLCELARALASFRKDRRFPRGDSWAASVAGIEPGPWQKKVPLCESPGPLQTPSIFGELWGIEEPMAFPEYVAFQDQYLALERREDADAAKAGADRRGPAEADPALR